MSRFETIGKSKQFFDFLKNEIISGEYKPGDKFPSIRDLAEKYGISNITVNSVISRLVTDGLLYVVQGRGTFVAEKRNTVKHGKRMIGVMLFDFSLENNVEAEMFNSIQQNLKEDYFLIPYNSYNNTDNFYKGLKGFVQLDVDGMIIVPPTAEDYKEDIISSIFKREIPVVSINRRISGIKADFVCFDFEEMAYRAANYILGKGRTGIALVEHDSPSIAPLMLKGFRRAHTEGNVSVKDELVFTWLQSYSNPELIIAGMINKSDGLIASDYLIYKGRKAIYDSKKRIPEDLSIVGINDTVYSRFMSPPLTAMPHPSCEIGREALNMLMDRLENNRNFIMEKSFVSDLIVRSS